MTFSETEALAILAQIPLLGSVKIRLLVDYFSSPQLALTAEAQQLEALPGFGPRLLANWQKRFEKEDWQKNFELAKRYQTQLVSYLDPRFPKRLLEITDPPVMLYIKGEIKDADQHNLAVIGTRHPTIYGQEMATQLSKELAHAGFTIVSGLARGVDTLAHEGALAAQGRTIAVLGSGLARLYPPENAALADKICLNGALISEFAMDCPPDRANFPRRNRLVSGMSLGTLLIEAPSASGAMITMDLAYRQQRKTFAIPGRADQESFKGNHRLIKDGRALLVENMSDIVHHFKALSGTIPERTCLPLPHVAWNSEEQKLWQHLPTEEVGFDEIYRLCKLPTAKLNVLLMSLVLKKAIKEFPGKIYKRQAVSSSCLTINE